MDQPINPFIKPDERPKICHTLDLPFDLGPLRVFLFDDIPGVCGRLFHAQRNLPAMLVHVKNLGFDRFPSGHDFGWMADFVRPGHLRDMNQPLDAGFQLHKSPIIGQADHFSLHTAPFRVFFFYLGPGIRSLLLHTQRNPACLTIVLQDQHFHSIPDGKHIGRMPYAAPGNIRNM